MKRYTWEYDGEIHSFFEKLCDATYPCKLFIDYADECCVLRRKSKNRFMLYYHRPHIRNSFIRVLFAKAEQTPTGVSITATLRMFLPVYIFLTVWFSGVLFGFITSLLASELLGIIITGLMLTTGILLTKLAKGKPERVLSLMDDICKI